ncbi:MULTISPECIES: CusA/CzcA family heavy metal efflux RND transporter [unclassified Thiobacillus]|uniref:efflux RND transporter permease subunit n=1 Tax=unclassified Thiobacillus TaxID=2646513 RepID=UPI000869561D|nr:MULTISPECIES: CusA/CzcA family heavy metal efflux RND transporter [unclassified Thiobacillus]ODV02173.1 MAG: cation transporter [Thiobacillus sp. SCN 63-57]
MVVRLIEWSLRNRMLVLLTACLVAVWGATSARHMALDAIPDLSDVQVIIQTPYAGQSPQTVEDQVTYPLASALLSVPKSTAVRGFSLFGQSFLYVLFKEGTDPYWARSRVLEYLAQAQPQLPAGVRPSLGPDASGVGWIFEYALVDRGHRYDPDRLRAVQDFFLKYELQSVPGVAEVASVGGMVRQFQIEVDPNRLAHYGLSLQQIGDAVRANNAETGGSVLEMGHAEYMVRMRGYLRSEQDFASIPLSVDARGVPVTLGDVAHIQTGPQARRGVADLDGEGEVTGGIVIMRYGENALDTLQRVKQRLQELRKGLPAGVELVTTYDRSGLIERAVRTLGTKLVEESLVVALVCLLFLLRLRSSLVAVVTLPLGVLTAFIVMQAQGVTANIMSLGGIAIAIGAMVDAAIVMVENLHKHLEHADEACDRWEVVRRSAAEVGPALFFSLLVITVSFLPVLTLTGQEGKLFAPLAYTKTYAMAASAALAVTLMPVLMGYLIRGRIAPERGNPVNRVLHRLYRPLLLFALRRPIATLLISALALASIAWPVSRTGSEFMPPLYEGDLLYMPTTLPGLSIDEAANVLQITDRLIRTLPEVDRVFGKAGRAESATDPAPLSMLETTILLKPREQWPPGETVEDVIHKLDQTVNLPGLTNAWGYPIRTRIDMLSTGIRTAVGVKVTGPELDGIVDLAQKIEAVVREVRGTRTVFAERVTRGRYIDIQVDRAQAARYGVSISNVQNLVQGAIGGEDVGTVVDGRERFSINLRYPRGYRDSLDALAASRVTTPAGMQVPLGEIAKLSIADGPAEIKSENGRLVGYVYVDIASGDLGGYVAAARDAVERSVPLPPGYAVQWAGQYLHLQHAKERLQWVVPLTFILVLLLLYLHFRHFGKVVLVMACLPLALVGSFWLVYALGYQFSVAVAVGFIALAGVAAEFGVVMLLYLDNAIDRSQRAGALQDRASLHQAIVEGALLRIRPKAMTVSVIIAGLLPILLGQGAGTDVMKRIAAPLVGGMVSAALLSLILIPVAYAYWHEKKLPSGR